MDFKGIMAELRYGAQLLSDEERANFEQIDQRFQSNQTTHRDVSDGAELYRRMKLRSVDQDALLRELEDQSLLLSVTEQEQVEQASAVLAFGERLDLVTVEAMLRIRANLIARQHHTVVDPRIEGGVAAAPRAQPQKRPSARYNPALAQAAKLLPPKKG